MFSGESRRVFREAVGLDDATWERARGWALWKALITLANGDEQSRRVIEEVLGDAP
jgi:aminoglycoside phosphotransferase (APT) family kinase protein